MLGGLQQLLHTSLGQTLAAQASLEQLQQRMGGNVGDSGTLPAPADMLLLRAEVQQLTERLQVLEAEAQLRGRADEVEVAALLQAAAAAGSSGREAVCAAPGQAAGGGAGSEGEGSATLEHQLASHAALLEQLMLQTCDNLARGGAGAPHSGASALQLELQRAQQLVGDPGCFATGA